MFERRLKILLGLVLVLAAVQLLRSAQLQLVQKGGWQKEAEKLMSGTTSIETSRGRIVDRKGLLIAEDAACIDAAVDYRAIAIDPDWIKKQAQARLRHHGELSAGTSRELLGDEMERVKADIDSMWALLARVGQKSHD